MMIVMRWCNQGSAWLRRIYLRCVCWNLSLWDVRGVTCCGSSCYGCPTYGIHHHCELVRWELLNHVFLLIHELLVFVQSLLLQDLMSLVCYLLYSCILIGLVYVLLSLASLRLSRAVIPTTVILVIGFSRMSLVSCLAFSSSFLLGIIWITQLIRLLQEFRWYLLLGLVQQILCRGLLRAWRIRCASAWLILITLELQLLCKCLIQTSTWNCGRGINCGACWIPVVLISQVIVWILLGNGAH